MEHVTAVTTPSGDPAPEKNPHGPTAEGPGTPLGPEGPGGPGSTGDPPRPVATRDPAGPVSTGAPARPVGTRDSTWSVSTRDSTWSVSTRDSTWPGRTRGSDGPGGNQAHTDIRRMAGRCALLAIQLHARAWLGQSGRNLNAVIGVDRKSVV